MKILTIIGARPQFIKAAALSRAIRNKFSDKIKEVIVHTGQHYDDNMSRVFFEEMEIPKEDYNLEVGSGSHGKQTASMISGIEELLLKEKPDCVVLYGDTNSTLAGAVAASKIHIPVVHIEAGLRSFNKSMPEEINRIICDHCSTLLFSPTKNGYVNLTKEGFSEFSKAPFTADNPKIYHCGDVMYDNAVYFSQIAENKSDILKQYELSPNNYILATIHRDNNTDDPERFASIFLTLNKISIENKLKIVLPLHPRTSKALQSNLKKEVYDAMRSNPNFVLMPPASFFEMIVLEKNCMIVCTDSGGVQKESFFFKKPCIILRQETEWVELVEYGTAILADVDEHKILNAFRQYKNKKNLSFPPIFGDGHASEFICQELVKNFIPT
ncbi:MAG: UDP-N-acetylglucosamine 2-epimerase (non-hydrolyzing) [Bacteroidetes bacterium]|nr:UDP-N-acetylglucosamine 2-epimerase (non-hydrolyzing) [Bacteroidota bacterium]